MRDSRLKMNIAYVSGDIAAGKVRKFFSSQLALVMRVDLHDQPHV
ncbi:hypothetical protein [Priestia aryabhattai]|nr:hypothetical protein [Priestia aryabhattai]